MSWSITASGPVPEVVATLTAHSNNLSDQSKIEYDAALPLLVGIVEQNFEPTMPATVTLEAYGHGYAEGDTQKQRYLTVKLQR